MHDSVLEIFETTRKEVDLVESSTSEALKRTISAIGTAPFIRHSALAPTVENADETCAKLSSKFFFEGVITLIDWRMSPSVTSCL